MKNKILISLFIIAAMTAIATAVYIHLRSNENEIVNEYYAIETFGREDLSGNMETETEIRRLPDYANDSTAIAQETLKLKSYKRTSAEILLEHFNEIDKAIGIKSGKWRAKMKKDKSDITAKLIEFKAFQSLLLRLRTSNVIIIKLSHKRSFKTDRIVMAIQEKGTLSNEREIEKYAEEGDLTIACFPLDVNVPVPDELIEFESIRI